MASLIGEIAKNRSVELDIEVQPNVEVMTELPEADIFVIKAKYT